MYHVLDAFTALEILVVALLALILCVGSLLVASAHPPMPPLTPTPTVAARPCPTGKPTRFPSPTPCCPTGTPLPTVPSTAYPMPTRRPSRTPEPTVPFYPWRQQYLPVIVKESEP